MSSNCGNNWQWPWQCTRHCPHSSRTIYLLRAQLQPHPLSISSPQTRTNRLIHSKVDTSPVQQPLQNQGIKQTEWMDFHSMELAWFAALDIGYSCIYLASFFVPWIHGSHQCMRLQQMQETDKAIATGMSKLDSPMLTIHAHALLYWSRGPGLD